MNKYLSAERSAYLLHLGFMFPELDHYWYEGTKYSPNDKDPDQVSMEPYKGDGLYAGTTLDPLGYCITFTDMLSILSKEHLLEFIYTCDFTIDALFQFLVDNKDKFNIKINTITKYV